MSGGRDVREQGVDGKVQQEGKGIRTKLWAI